MDIICGFISPSADCYVRNKAPPLIPFNLRCKMINTAIEFTLDAVYKNKYSKLVGMAKDIAAGAVMLSASASVVIGLLLFWKNIFD